MVTPLSIPSFATRGPDADLSFDEGSDKVLEDSKDKPAMKKRIFYSNEDDDGEHETEAMGMCLLPLSDLLSLSFFFFGYNSLIVLHINFP